MKKLLLVAMIFIMSCVGPGNLDYLRENAKEFFDQNGFEIVGHEGYTWGGVMPFTSYGGARVWYIVKRKGKDNTIYNCYLKRWGNEIHIYKFKAINAIGSID